MFANLRERFRQWWYTRDRLLVCFGNNPGRVPMAFLHRNEVVDLIQKDEIITFSSSGHEGWIFVVHATNSSAAVKIAADLKSRRIYSLAAVDDIKGITHTRPEDGEPNQPCLIAGDIRLANVSEDDYLQNGNGAWILKSLWKKGEDTGRRLKKQLAELQAMKDQAE